MILNQISEEGKNCEPIIIPLASQEAPGQDGVYKVYEGWEMPFGEYSIPNGVGVCQDYPNSTETIYRDTRFSYKCGPGGKLTYKLIQRDASLTCSNGNSVSRNYNLSGVDELRINCFGYDVVIKKPSSSKFIYVL